MATLTEPAHAPTPAPVAAAPACLYCGGCALDPLYAGVRDRLGYVPGERAFLRCRGCGSAVLDPLPRADELAAFYPPVYSFSPELGRHNRLSRFLSGVEYRLFYRPQYRANVAALAAKIGRDGKGRTLLDIGAGRGLRLLEFRRLGFDVCGLDLQPDVVRYLRDELKIPAACADVGELDRFHPPGSVDVVTAFYLVEHIPDVRGFLDACYRVLRPGGWLAAGLPFLDSVQGSLFGGRWINVREAPRHLSLPTYRGATGAFAAAGFEAVDIVPDSLLNCAGSFASSAVPGATLTHAYTPGNRWGMVRRLVGAGVTFATMPLSVVENYVVRRPPLGIVVGRKPAG